MKRLLFAAAFLAMALPVFAQGPEAFVGDWKSDPGTPTMTRKLALDGKIIVMTELQPGRNGGPELTIIRKYPTDGSTVKMDTGMWDGSTATGKMDNGVLTCDTTMPNGTKFHDVWTLAADGKSYTNDMVISGGPPRNGGQGGNGGGQGGNGGQGNSAPPRTIKFSFTRVD
ncbi:MAG TPA: hypothetical protein VMD78_14000 [Candidatus Baltobacteraceae bacterium]|nr:hypothetical protein [Candidatus Baltobacteraceae bacterium]